MSEGYNIFRVPFAMERMAPGSVGAALSPTYLANYSAVINHITAKGGWALVDPHNFGRYNGAIITDITAFQTFWTNLAANYKDNTNAVSRSAKIRIEAVD
jgi:endoglucanase